MKDVIQKRFEEKYPKKRLLAAHLNGFAHSVFYDSGSKTSDIIQESYSAYAPEQDWPEETQYIFYDIPHHPFQNRATEYVYVDKDKR